MRLVGNTLAFIIISRRTSLPHRNAARLSKQDEGAGHGLSFTSVLIAQAEAASQARSWWLSASRRRRQAMEAAARAAVARQAVARRQGQSSWPWLSRWQERRQQKRVGEADH